MKKTKRLTKKILTTLLSLFCAAMTAGAQVSVTASAPRKVEVGQKFQLIFTMHCASPDSFRLDGMKHIELVSGPRKTYDTNYGMLNGRLVQYQSVNLVFIARATKAGTQTIPKARLYFRGKAYESQAMKVSISDEAKKAAEEQARQKPEYEEIRGGEIADDDILLKTEWANKNVYAKEHNELLVRLYYRANVAGWQNLELPKIKRCESADAGIAYNKRYGKAQVNGKAYNTVVVAVKEVMPEEEGELVIESGTIDIVINVPNKNSFWGGYHTGIKKFDIPGLTTTVQKREKANAEQGENEKRRDGLETRPVQPKAYSNKGLNL